MAAESVPKSAMRLGAESWHEIQGQRAVARTCNVFPQLLLVRREDADAATSAGDGHIPLLRVGRGPDGRVGEQDIINGFALGPVGGHRVASGKLSVAGVQNPSVHEFNRAIGANIFYDGQFAIGYTTS